MGLGETVGKVQPAHASGLGGRSGNLGARLDGSSPCRAEDHPLFRHTGYYMNRAQTKLGWAGLLAMGLALFHASPSFAQIGIGGIGGNIGGIGGLGGLGGGLGGI